MLNCDRCEQDFEMDIRLDMVEVEGERVQRRFFECPHCYKRYTIMVYTKKLRKMLKNNTPKYLTKPELDRVVYLLEGYNET